MAVTKAQRGWLLWVLFFVFCLPLTAAVLPEDQFDVLYHHYDGGGVSISGPSLQFRKQVAEQVSMSAHYYVDTISSASIDVISQASPYNEERTEYSANIDYLNGKNLLSLGYTTSSENDYVANTVSLGISQEFFSGLTNISLGFARGWDTVSRSTDDWFEEKTERRSYNIGISQVITKNTLIAISGNVTTDEGYLNNPYRSYRYLPTGNTVELLSEEIYPGTRTSSALAIRGLYYLPYRAAIGGEFRQFADTWDVSASNWQLFYRHPTPQGWTYEVRYRQYSQTKANFYADMFSSQFPQDYMARDKELSTYTSQSFGLSAHYEFKSNWTWLDKGSINMSWDRLQFDYADFRDANANAPAGEEPLYSFSANVIQLYLSIWY